MIKKGRWGLRVKCLYLSPVCLVYKGANCSSTKDPQSVVGVCAEVPGCSSLILFSALAGPWSFFLFNGLVGL